MSTTTATTTAASACTTTTTTVGTTPPPSSPLHHHRHLHYTTTIPSFLRSSSSSHTHEHHHRHLHYTTTTPSFLRPPFVLQYIGYDTKTGAVGKKRRLEIDAGADGANSQVAKAIGAGDYEYAIAFQERIKIPDENMAYYENLAEMYVGDDVSPDFYGWVFPKCDHVPVLTEIVTHKGDIKKFQLATRNRANDKILGGKIIRVEAHPIPEHPRLKRLSDRVADKTMEIW